MRLEVPNVFTMVYIVLRMIGLTLPEAFSISLVGLVGHGDHVCKVLLARELV